MKSALYTPFFHRRLLVTAIGLSAVLSGLHASAQSAAPPAGAPTAPAAPAAPATLVTTAIVKSDPVQQTVTSTGNAVALSTVTVHARVDGQLESVAFEDGQEVRAGQVLAKLDSRTYQALLDQARATKAKDAALLLNAQNDLKRYQALIKDDATTQQVLDTQTALVNQLTATLQSDTAQVNYASVQLEYTTITAPISGRVGARLIDPGNIVHAADTTGLVVINQVDPIGLQFTVPEGLLQAVRQAVSGSHKQRLKVEALDRNSQQVLGAGELVLVNNQIDATSGTITLKARLPNAQLKLWPGQSVNVRLSLSTLNDVVSVPSSAVQRSQNGLFVYVVGAEDKIRLQSVTVATTEGNMSAISKGLKAGDRVVIDGLYRLTPGATIKEAPKAGAKP